MNKAIIIVPLVVAVGILIFPFVAYFGNNIMVVTSDSMFPALKPNDLIIVKPFKIEEIKEGDIIAFDSHMYGIGIVSHRAIAVADDDGIIGLDTKGDNNIDDDPWTVHDEDLIGIVIEVIPAFGILLIEPVRYTLVAVIVITAVSLLKEIITEAKKTSSKTKSENK